MQFPGGFGLDGMGAMFGGMGMGGGDDGSALPPRNAGYVKLHASDNGIGLNPLFLTENPKEFVPRKNPTTGVYENWGTNDGWSSGMNEVMHRMMMRNNYIGLMSPEAQFVKPLKKRKYKKLKSELPERQPLFERDFVLCIELCRGDLESMEPRLYRRVAVSGGLALRVFHDRVLGPAMGWVRNYHGYFFTDPTDGAVFGCEESRAIDMMHKELNVSGMLDDSRVHLAQVLFEEGMQLLYMYDLGDHWYHKITLESIKPKEESTGAVQLLEGALACPPEDSRGFGGMGSDAYQEEVLDCFGPGKRLPRARQDEANGANNVSGQFDAYKFDLEEARRRVKEAISSKASVKGGELQYSIPVSQLMGRGNSGAGSGGFGGLGMGPSPGEDPMKFRAAGLKSAHRVQKKIDLDDPYADELVRKEDEKDPRKERVCGNCGSPNDLMKCSGCKLAWYCGRACQQAAWNGHKKMCKKMQGEREEAKADDTDDVDPDWNPDIVWEYEINKKWVRYKKRIECGIEDLMNMGAEQFMYTPGDPDCDGKYEEPSQRSPVPPRGVATHFVVYKDMVEIEIYTGVRRRVRRSGPKPV